ncbi:MAG: Flp pilus assembly protein CpaB [Planctomycetaceae bacterium]
MKNQTLLLLVIAGGCGLVAMLGVQQYLASKGKQDDVATVQVLVAATNIDPGTPLNELNTRFMTVEQSVAPEGVVTNLEQIQERSLKVPRDSGDWIMLEQLGPPGQTGASAVIPQGMRVTTINVDATTSHSGMLRPGNRIDLLLTYASKDPKTRERVEKVTPLLQYIEVFAVGDQVYGVTAAGENPKAQQISLLVDTEQMMRLEIGKKKGTISTVLRSNDDREEVKIKDMTEESLDGRSRDVINETSVVSSYDSHMDDGLTLPAEQEQPGIFNALAANFAGSGPVTQTEDYWTMNIHEGGTLRRERVNLKSENPLVDEPSPSQKSSSKPAASLPTLEGIEGFESDEGFRLPEGMDAELTESDLDGLEQAASGLLELFN